MQDNADEDGDGDEPDLLEELTNDMLFVMALQDDRFAKTVFSVFVNRTFFKGTKEKEWQAGLDEVVWFIAELRGLGEDPILLGSWPRYDDVWPDDRPAMAAKLKEEAAWMKRAAELGLGDDRMTTMGWEMHRKRVEAFEDPENRAVLEEVVGHLVRLGWHPQTEEDRERMRRSQLQRRVEILRDIVALEARPAAPTPGWAEAFRKRDFRPHTISRRSIPDLLSEEERQALCPHALRERLEGLALTRRIAKQDFDRLREELDSHGDPLSGVARVVLGR